MIRQQQHNLEKGKDEETLISLADVRTVILVSNLFFVVDGQIANSSVGIKPLFN